MVELRNTEKHKKCNVKQPFFHEDFLKTYWFEDAILNWRNEKLCEITDIRLTLVKDLNNKN